MIIEHLRRVYETKDVKCVALNDVSFVLPDKGLIFIVGKSGSGKSTLLNMLGGLDGMTSGDIVFDGKRFSQFTSKDFDNYRNLDVGFIFQDYCLIDQLTVRENIRLSLDLIAKPDYGHTDKILKLVDLDGYGDRYPGQLSGGQRQRVAIARAVVKKPRLILADEPTGNIDSKTSVQLLELLKELSKDMLVVIVSHSLSDAEHYGDRIIELADGDVESDVSKRENADNSFKVEDDTAYVPNGVKMTETELELLNHAVKGGNVRIVQREDAFVPTVQPQEITRDSTASKVRLSLKNICLTSWAFLKKRVFNCIITVFLVAAVAVLFGLSQTFVGFDDGLVLENALGNSGNPALVMTKGYLKGGFVKKLDSEYIVPVTDEDMRAFASSGVTRPYERICLPFSMQKESIEFNCGYANTIDNYKNFYAKEGRGVIVCEKSFLDKLYGVNGRDYLISGSLAESDGNDVGVIVTDYFLDSLNYYTSNRRSYGSYVNSNLLASEGYSYRIKAVINTGYKERYAELIKAARERSMPDSELAAVFVAEADNYLGAMYSFNPNFKNAFIEREIYSVRTWKSDVSFAGESHEIPQNYIVNFSYNPLDVAYVRMSIKTYNSIFGTNYTSEYDLPEGDTCYFNYYDYGSEKPLYTHKATIKIQNVSENYLYVHDFELKDALIEHRIATCALYFEDYSNLKTIYDAGIERGIHPDSEYFEAVQSITSAVKAFSQVFELILVGMCAVMVLLMATFVVSNIRRRSYEIGVMRALGAKITDVAVIFLLQVLVIGLLICVLYVPCFYGVVSLTDEILLKNLTDMMVLPVSGFELLTVNGSVIGIDIGVLLSVTVLSSIIPFWAVARIKPLKIIKAKE